jgi:hypothetical protein
MFQLILLEQLFSRHHTLFNPMLTERTIFSLCEVLTNGVLQVRLSDQILDGEKVKSSTYRRYCLVPGDDLTGQPEQVVKIANAVWTPDVIAAYKQQLANNQFLKP